MRLSAVAIVLILLFSTPCLAQDFGIELHAGEDHVQGRFEYRRMLTKADLILGLGGFYRRDAPVKLSAFEALVGVGSGSMWPALRFDVGLKALFGQAEGESGDGDLGGAGFYVAGRLFLDEWMPWLPLSLFGDVTYVPEALAFGDTDSFLQSRLGLGLHLMEAAVIQVGYQYDRVEYVSGGEDRSADDGAIFFGLRLTF